jgi:hypothetical protein
MNSESSQPEGGVKMVWILEGKLEAPGHQWVFLNVTATRAAAREWAADYRESGFRVRIARRKVWDR